MARRATRPRKRGRQTLAAIALTVCIGVLSATMADGGNDARAVPIPATTTDAGDAVLGSFDDALLADAMRLIERSEGRRRRAYRDSRGYATVGVGFNLDRRGASNHLAAVLPGVSHAGLRAGRISLTDDQIDRLFQHDTAAALASARRMVAGFDTLPRHVRLVLIDMTYNLGSLRGWACLRAAVARGDFDAAANAMADSRWSRQVGDRAGRLIGMMRGEKSDR